MASLISRPSKSGTVWYVQCYSGPKLKRFRSSDIFQVAKQKLRDFEDAHARGETASLATRTPIPLLLNEYVAHIRSMKTAKSAQTDIYYLRDAFGPVCDALKITSRRISSATKKRPPKPGQDRRRTATVIEATSFEAITTAQISTFISGRMANRRLAPKTGNRIRDTLSPLFSWAMTQRGVRFSGDKNPDTAATKYKEPAPEIRFLTLAQIDEQLEHLAPNLQLQVMVAMLIFAGLRREELLWLTPDDFDIAGGKHGLLRIRAKTIEGLSWQPKTKRNRAVPVSSRLRLFLDKWRLKNTNRQWLFASPAGMRFDPDNFSRALRDANAGKKLDWTNLDYRHTFGSQLAMKGESLYKIATLMGNSPEICRRHYAALVPESMFDSVEFGPTSPAPVVQSLTA